MHQEAVNNPNSEWSFLIAREVLMDLSVRAQQLTQSQHHTHDRNPADTFPQFGKKRTL
jgi:hypothetical protein